ncbi:TRAP transporter substrate-binding protein [Thauera phenylacetica]|jgi:TRAP-type C4-dicarboxylate transport system substrate-binding protein|uniref:TRAP transporter substrate-binding protein n=1 Tax=Thauera phenylacetica TaxID=164400 RepID=UPI0002F1E10E|nr:TRAP transporter substrate-binding protein [Thauera phenylacetica]HRM68412.1 TRAP transporter substrate-binding protein [Thauera phenylacetica]
MQRRYLGAGLVAMTAALSSTAAQSQEVILKVSHMWPTAALGHRQIVPWCEKIAAESDNRMKCQIYPAMQIGGTPAQVYQQVVDGIADIGWTLPGYNPGRFPSVEVFELPFMSRKAETTSRALWEYYERYGAGDFAQVKPLAFHVHDNGQAHNNRHPIRTMADFKGLKMRAPTRLTNRMLSQLGASAVGMPMPAVVEAVSKGVVDGYLLPWEIVPAMKLHELTRYHSETAAGEPALYTAVFVLAMNKARYEGLPPELKRVIDANSGVALSAAIGRAWDESAAPARQLAVGNGNQFNSIPASETASWRAVGDKIAVEWVGEVTAKGYPGQEMLDEARRLLAKHSAP